MATKRRKATPAEQVRELRRGMGLSQQALADLLGVARPTVTRWETGVLRVRKLTLTAIRFLVTQHTQCKTEEHRR